MEYRLGSKSNSLLGFGRQYLLKHSYILFIFDLGLLVRPCLCEPWFAIHSLFLKCNLSVGRNHALRTYHILSHFLWFHILLSCLKLFSILILISLEKSTSMSPLWHPLEKATWKSQHLVQFPSCVCLWLHFLPWLPDTSFLVCAPSQCHLSKVRNLGLLTTRTSVVPNS